MTILSNFVRFSKQLCGIYGKKWQERHLQFEDFAMCPQLPMKKQQHTSGWPLRWTNGSSFVLFYVSEVLKEQWTLNRRGALGNKISAFSITFKSFPGSSGRKWKVRCLCQLLFFRNIPACEEGDSWAWAIQNHHKGAGSFHDIRKSMKKLCANDTSRYPKVLKIGPNHGCQ